MRRLLKTGSRVALFGVVLALSIPAHGQTTPAPPVVTWITPGATAPAPSASAPAPTAPGASLAPIAAGPAHGLAVLAVGDTGSIAWPLAQSVYADTSLRPPFGEARARVLVGERPAGGAPSELTDLAETRAAIRGADAPSRQLLAGVAAALHVTGIVVVTSDGGAPASARVFVASTGAFDAARYSAEGPSSWSATVDSLHRTFGVAPPPPVMAPVAPIKAESHGRVPFYKSPWFWGALGAAAFGAGAVYFATRDNSPNTIHLEVQVPK